MTKSAANPLYTLHFKAFVEEVMVCVDIITMTLHGFTYDWAKMDQSKTSRTILESVSCRIIDQLVIYLNRMLTDIIRKDQRLVLRLTDAKVSTSDLVDHLEAGKSLDDLVGTLAEKIIMTFNEKKAPAQAKIIKRLLGFNLVDEPRRQLLQYLTCMRNCICHQGGIIDEQFVQTVQKECPLLITEGVPVVGDTLELDLLSQGIAVALLINIAAIFDNHACEHWGMQREVAPDGLDGNAAYSFNAHQAELKQKIASQAGKQPAETSHSGPDLGDFGMDPRDLNAMIPNHFDPTPAPDLDGAEREEGSEPEHPDEASRVEIS